MNSQKLSETTGFGDTKNIGTSYISTTLPRCISNTFHDDMVNRAFLLEKSGDEKLS